MSAFSLTLQILRDDQPVGGPVGLGPPLERGAEALRWRCLCEEGRELSPADVSVAPVWKEEGPPLVRAVQFSTPDRRHAVELDTQRLYSRDARRTSMRLVAQEELQEGDLYGFRIAAHPRGGGPNGAPPVPFLDYEVTECKAPPTATRCIDPEFAKTGDMDVFCDEQVLADAMQLANEAGEEEAGSILLGHVQRSATLGHAPPFLHVTALIPAEGGERGRTSFEFTPEGFNRARVVQVERGASEIFCGWQHNHPDLCSPNCSPEKREVCALRQPFLSDHDLVVQETVFPAPFNVALLISNDGKQLTPTLWGWRDGFMARRSFHLTNHTEK